MFHKTIILALAIADFLEKNNVEIDLKASDFRGEAARRFQDALLSDIDHRFPPLAEEIGLVLHTNYADPNTTLGMIAALLEEEGLYTPDERSVQPLYADESTVSD